MMATVIFHPIGNPDEVMRLDVEASNRVEAVTKWMAMAEANGRKPESFVVIGVAGLKNRFEERWRIEEERRNG